MGAKSKADIIAFYDDFPQKPGWAHLEAVRLFLPVLFRERELSGCTFFTSHETLCIVRYPTYPEWCDKPSLFINCASKERLRLSFRILLSAEPVHRTLTEDVVCSLPQGLDEFDRLYAKFLAAHGNH
jgi:hypothetical protein